MGDHVTLRDRVMVGPQAGIPSGKEIRSDQTVLGSPARPIEKVKRQAAAQTRLPEMVREVSRLRKVVGEIQAHLQKDAG